MGAHSAAYVEGREIDDGDCASVRLRVRAELDRIGRCRCNAADLLRGIERGTGNPYPRSWGKDGRALSCLTHDRSSGKGESDRSDNHPVVHHLETSTWKLPDDR